MPVDIQPFIEVGRDRLPGLLGIAIDEIDKGHEVSEIDASAREWNAHAAEGGSLRLGTVPAEPEGDPAGTES